LAIVLVWDCKNSTIFGGSRAVRIVTFTNEATLLPANRPRASSVEREAIMSISFSDFSNGPRRLI
jgi:hypothetical protein